MTGPAEAAAPARGRRHATLHELRVAAIEPLTADSVAITFAVPDHLRDDYAFVHGQHVSVRLPAAGDELRRSYSICSTPSSGVLRIAVKRLAGGVFSTYAHSRLRVGDSVEVVTPTGRFTTPLDPRRRGVYAGIAAGSGVTPIMSIMATTLEVERRSSFTLLYGNRSVADTMFLEELQALKNRHPDRLTLLHAFSRESQEVELLDGRIDGPRLETVLDRLLPPEDVDEWFLCGPREMIETLRATLLGRGVDPHHVHAELFHVGDLAARPAPGRGVEEGGGPESSARVTIRLDGRSSSLRLAPGGEPILDAALRVRSDAPYACKDGVCGTCRVRVVSGEVRMDRNFALEEDEVAAGYALACQSHPASAEVTVDFDQ